MWKQYDVCNEYDHWANDCPRKNDAATKEEGKDEEAMHNDNCHHYDRENSIKIVDSNTVKENCYDTLICTPKNHERNEKERGDETLGCRILD